MLNSFSSTGVAILQPETLYGLIHCQKCQNAECVYPTRYFGLRAVKIVGFLCIDRSADMSINEKSGSEIDFKNTFRFRRDALQSIIIINTGRRIQRK